MMPNIYRNKNNFKKNIQIFGAYQYFIYFCSVLHMYNTANMLLTIKI